MVTGARLLDGFHYGDFNISTFLASLDKPEDALAGIIKPTDLMNHRDRGIPGMLRFMTFCREFAPALDAEKTVAEVRTAMAGLLDGHYGAALLKCLSQLE